MSYITENGGHMTAETIAGGLRERGLPVGQATVYRNLERLVGEGALFKIEQPGSSACYQYVGIPLEHESHYHMMCTDCGQLQHLNCEVLDHLAGHIRKTHSFQLNTLRTILYGRCDNCNSLSGN